MNKEIYQRYFKKNKNGLSLLILTIGIGTIVSGINPYIYGKIIDSISEKNIYSLKRWLLFFWNRSNSNDDFRGDRVSDRKSAYEYNRKSNEI